MAHLIHEPDAPGPYLRSWYLMCDLGVVPFPQGVLDPDVRARDEAVKKDGDVRDQLLVVVRSSVIALLVRGSVRGPYSCLAGHGVQYLLRVSI